jgi:hypothetical protein
MSHGRSSAFSARAAPRPQKPLDRHRSINAYAEALFRTAKYRPDFPGAGFADLAEARQWAAAFVRWYNHEHRHSGIRYVSPAQRHAAKDRPILAARQALYQQAREANPRRWSGPTRDWTPIGPVALNPERDSAAATLTMLSSPTGEPAFPSRPGGPAATARSRGDGRRADARSHVQRSGHGEDGEHRPFAAASAVAASRADGADGADAHQPKPG